MEGIQDEIRRTLETLRATIRARGFTQIQVQERLGWGRSAISQILTGQRALRVGSLMRILQAIDVAPGAFYAQLYGWPSSEPAAELPRRAPGEEVDRVLDLLATRIRAQGPTMTAVERRLGWGRSYVSHLLKKKKRLRVEQLLAMLGALEIAPREFFWELYRPVQFEQARQHGEAGPRMEVMLEGLTGAMAELSSTLVRKGLLNVWDLPALFQPVDADGPPPIDERQLSLPIAGDET